MRAWWAVAIVLAVAVIASADHPRLHKATPHRTKPHEHRPSAALSEPSEELPSFLLPDIASDRDLEGAVVQLRSGAKAKKQAGGRAPGSSASELISAVTSGPTVLHHPPASHRTHRKVFSMPMAATHKHLLLEGEVTPGISVDEYRDRREALMADQPPKTAALFFAADHKIMSNDVEYEYVPDANLWYLSGVSDPKVALLLYKRADRSLQSMLILDFHPSAFTSDVIDPVASQSIGLEAFYLSDKNQFATIFAEASAIHYPEGSCEMDAHLRSIVDKSKIRPSLASKVVTQRRLKSAAEQKLLTEIFEISANAHNWAMKLTSSGTHETYLRAVTSFFLEKEYAQYAYPPIIAAGVHGHVLHYHSDNDVIRDGEMILMDVGGLRFGYAADITRSWPANCKFSKAQREIYEIVLDAQNAALERAKQYATLTKDGVKHDVTLEDLHRTAVASMEAGLRKLKISKSVHDLFKHSTCHALGIDLHDCSGASTVIDDGYVFTIEPGLYFPDDESVAAQYRGLNIRIEDDCIAKDSTVTCPSMTAARTVEEIEKICGHYRR